MKVLNVEYFMFFEFCIQDSIFNPATDNGWMTSNLKTRRTKNKKVSTSSTSNDSAEDIIESVCSVETIASTSSQTKNQHSEEMIFLKRTLYAKETESLIKEKMLSTIELRENLIFDEKEDYFTNFPYLFCESGLVSL